MIAVTPAPEFGFPFMILLDYHKKPDLPFLVELPIPGVGGSSQ
jgi:hypothetical protein